MQYVRKYITELILIFLLIAANWFMMDAQRVEEWYAKGIYVYISKVLQLLMGWLPFSVGDVLYIAAGVYIILTLHKSFKRPILKTLNRAFKVASIVWLMFHVLWGFNYYRRSIPDQFNLARGEVKKEEIVAFATYTLNEANRYSTVKFNQYHPSSTFGGQALSHQGGLGAPPILGGEYSDNSQSARADKPTTHNPPRRTGSQPSPHPGGQAVKPSIFGIIGNYMGYGGYYNPFTGEAQVNSYMPAFMLPYITVHEAAHQKGYAKESEANFIGYLTAMESGDSALLYSANLEMFLYANSALRRFDSTLAKKNMEQLSTRIKKDLAEYKAFAQKYYGPVDKFVTWFYSGFLNLNNQPEGMMSYNRGMVYVMRYVSRRKL